MEAKSANALLDSARQVRSQATFDEIKLLLGPPSYTFEPPSFPPWLERSAVGKVTDGTVIVYLVGRPPRLLIIHLSPAAKVQFVTWEST